MLKAGALVVLAALAAAPSIPPSQSHQQAVRVQPNQQPQGAGQAQHKTTNTPKNSKKPSVVRPRVIHAVDANACGDQCQERADERSRTWIIGGHRLGITDSLLAAFTAILVFIGWWQGIQLRKSVGAARIGERAYVFPGNPRAFVRPMGSLVLYYRTLSPEKRGPKPSINFELINYGRSPAIIMQVRTSMEFIGDEIPKYPMFEHSTLWEGETILAKDSRSEVMTFTFHRNITPDELDQINAGEITPFFYGFVLYRDVFGYLHQHGWGNIFTAKSLDGATQIGGRAFNYSRSRRWKEPSTPLWVVLFIRPLARIQRALAKLGPLGKNPVD